MAAVQGPTPEDQYKRFVTETLRHLQRGLELDGGAKKRRIGVKLGTQLDNDGKTGAQHVLAGRFALGADDAAYLQSGVSTLWTTATEPTHASGTGALALAPPGLYAPDAVDGIRQGLVKALIDKNENLKRDAGGVLNLLKGPLKVLFSLQVVKNALKDAAKPTRRAAMLVAIDGALKADWSQPATRDAHGETMYAFLTVVGDVIENRSNSLSKDVLAEIANQQQRIADLVRTNKEQEANLARLGSALHDAQLERQQCIDDATAAAAAAAKNAEALRRNLVKANKHGKAASAAAQACETEKTQLQADKARLLTKLVESEQKYGATSKQLNDTKELLAKVRQDLQRKMDQLSAEKAKTNAQDVVVDTFTRELAECEQRKAELETELDECEERERGAQTMLAEVQRQVRQNEVELAQATERAAAAEAQGGVADGEIAALTARAVAAEKAAAEATAKAVELRRENSRLIEEQVKLTNQVVRLQQETGEARQNVDAAEAERDMAEKKAKAAERETATAKRKADEEAASAKKKAAAAKKTADAEADRLNKAIAELQVVINKQAANRKAVDNLRFKAVDARAEEWRSIMGEWIRSTASDGTDAALAARARKVADDMAVWSFKQRIADGFADFVLQSVFSTRQVIADSPLAQNVEAARLTANAPDDDDDRLCGELAKAAKSNRKFASPEYAAALQQLCFNLRKWKLYHFGVAGDGGNLLLLPLAAEPGVTAAFVPLTGAAETFVSGADNLAKFGELLSFLCDLPSRTKWKLQYQQKSDGSGSMPYLFYEYEGAQAAAVESNKSFMEFSLVKGVVDLATNVRNAGFFKWFAPASAGATPSENAADAAHSAQANAAVQTATAASGGQAPSLGLMVKTLAAGTVAVVASGAGGLGRTTLYKGEQGPTLAQGPPPDVPAPTPLETPRFEAPSFDAGSAATNPNAPLGDDEQVWSTTLGFMAPGMNESAQVANEAAEIAGDFQTEMLEAAIKTNRAMSAPLDTNVLASAPPDTPLARVREQTVGDYGEILQTVALPAEGLEVVTAQKLYDQVDSALGLKDTGNPQMNVAVVDELSNAERYKTWAPEEALTESAGEFLAAVDRSRSMNRKVSVSLTMLQPGPWTEQLLLPPPDLPPPPAPEVVGERTPSFSETVTTYAPTLPSVADGPLYGPPPYDGSRLGRAREAFVRASQLTVHASGGRLNVLPRVTPNASSIIVDEDEAAPRGGEGVTRAANLVDLGRRAGQPAPPPPADPDPSPPPPAMSDGPAARAPTVTPPSAPPEPEPKPPPASLFGWAAGKLMGAAEGTYGLLSAIAEQASLVRGDDDGVEEDQLGAEAADPVEAERLRRMTAEAIQQSERDAKAARMGRLGLGVEAERAAAEQARAEAVERGRRESAANVLNERQFAASLGDAAAVRYAVFRGLVGQRGPTERAAPAGHPCAASDALLPYELPDATALARAMPAVKRLLDATPEPSAADVRRAFARANAKRARDADDADPDAASVATAAEALCAFQDNFAIVGATPVAADDDRRGVEAPHGVRWLPLGKRGACVARVAALEHAVARCEQVAASGDVSAPAAGALRRAAASLKLEQLPHLYALHEAVEHDDAPPALGTSVPLVTRPCAVVRGVFSYPSDARLARLPADAKEDAPPGEARPLGAPAEIATALDATAVATAALRTRLRAEARGRAPTGASFYVAPAPGALRFRPAPGRGAADTGVAPGARVDLQACANVAAGDLSRGLWRRIVNRAMVHLTALDDETVANTNRLLQAAADGDAPGALVGALERREALWTEFRRHVAISQDRLWVFVRLMSGCVGGDLNEVVTMADEATLKATKAIQDQRVAIAKRVSDMQAKIVETVVSGMVRESKLVMDKDDAGGVNQLVVVDGAARQRLGELASGESGRPFFEANVAVRNLRDGAAGAKTSLSELLQSLAGVGEQLQASLETTLTQPGAATASLTELSHPANSYYISLRTDAIAAIRVAHERLNVELGIRRASRRLHLWELVEGGCTPLSTRFAEFAGHMLVQARSATGVAALYVSQHAIQTNAYQARMALDRVVRVAALYAERVGAPRFGVGTLAARDAAITAGSGLEDVEIGRMLAGPRWGVKVAPNWEGHPSGWSVVGGRRLT